MTEGIVFNELTKFEKNLIDLAQKKMPKETKNFLRKEGTKLKSATAKAAKSKVGKEKGNYHKSVKRGKLYKYRRTGDFAIRAYSSAPHAHLIEYGHRQVVNPIKDGKQVKGRGIGTQVGFIQGYRVFETAAKGFEGQFYKDTQEFIDESLRKGL